MYFLKSSPEEMLRQREKQLCKRDALIGCFLYTPRLRIKSTIQVCALTEN